MAIIMLDLYLLIAIFTNYMVLAQTIFETFRNSIYLEIILVIP